MKNKKVNLLIGFISILMLVWIVVTYNKLPDRIPTHWGIDGKVDGYGSKNTIWLFFGIMVGINFLMILISKIDPKADNYKRFGRAFDIFRAAMTIFFAIILGVTLIVSQGNNNIDMGKIIPIMVGVLFIVIGNYMPKFKQNYTMGIKTPWTLANENVWNKTHRVSGQLWMIGGIIFVILSIFAEAKMLFVLLIVLVTVLSVVPIVYSYFVYKNEIKNK